MAHGPRISKNPAKFHTYMKVTDNLQKSVLSPPSTLRYTLFGWTQKESLAWSDFRLQTEKTYAIYSDPTKTGPTPRKKMKLLIKKVRAYDNDKIKGHHLLDKVAVNGTFDDWLTFNIKRGTSLAAQPSRRKFDPSATTPLLTILRNTEGFHLIRVANSKDISAIKLPDGMAFAKIFCYIGSEKPFSQKQYTLIGNAKRGRYLHSFENVKYEGKERLYAWYYACYESKSGKMGLPGAVMSAGILLALQ